jgi:uncharacterized protein YegJ (DUF2314 family)
MKALQEMGDLCLPPPKTAHSIARRTERPGNMRYCERDLERQQIRGRLAMSLMAAVALLVMACRSREPSPVSTTPSSFPEIEGTPVAGNSLVVEPVEIGFDLYFISRPVKDPTEVLARLAKGTTPELYVQKGVPKWPLPEPNPSFYIGLSDSQVRGLVASKQRPFGVRFKLSMAASLAPLKAAERLVWQLTHDTGGFIYDYTADRVFSVNAFLSSRLDGWSGDVPDVRDQIAIAGGRHGSLWRSATHGMERFGLPDVAIADHAASNLQSIGNLLNLVAQTLAERRALDGNGRLHIDISAIRHPEVKRALSSRLLPGATGTANLRVVKIKREDMDEHNRLLLIAFRNSSPGSIQEQHEQLLGSVFGADDRAVPVKHDQAYLAASRRARAQLPSEREKFMRGLAYGEHIFVYAPFQHPTGTEWMWVEVTEWQNGRIKGLLMNTPERAMEAKAGAVVQLSETDVADYFHRYPDGRSEGNETGRLSAERKARPRKTGEISR